MHFRAKSAPSARVRKTHFHYGFLSKTPSPGFFFLRMGDGSFLRARIFARALSANAILFVRAFLLRAHFLRACIVARAFPCAHCVMRAFFARAHLCVCVSMRVQFLRARIFTRAHFCARTFLRALFVHALFPCVLGFLLEWGGAQPAHGMRISCVDRGAGRGGLSSVCLSVCPRWERGQKASKIPKIQLLL